MTYAKYDKIGREIAKELIKIPNVKAVAYIGSMSSGFVDSISKDIDMICLVDRLPSIEERRKILGERDYFEGSTSIYMEGFKISDVRIDIVFKEIRWIEGTLDYNMEPADDAAEKNNLYPIQNMKIIIDDENIIKNLKKRAEYTDSYQKRKIEFLFSVLAHRKFILDKPLKRKNMIFVNYIFSDSVEKYISAIYALNKKYYSDSKWSEKIISSFKIKPKNSLSNIKHMIMLDSKPNDVNKKIKILKNMNTELAKIILKHIPDAKIDAALEELGDWQ